MAISAGKIILGGGALFLVIWGLGSAGSHSPTSPPPEIPRTEVVPVRMDMRELEQLRLASDSPVTAGAVSAEIERLKQEMFSNARDPTRSLLFTNKAQFDADMDKLNALSVASYWFKFPNCFGVVNWVPNIEGSRNPQGQPVESCIGTPYTSSTSAQDDAQYEASTRVLAANAEKYINEIAASLMTNQQEQPVVSDQQSVSPCSDSECVTARVGNPIVPGAIVCRDLDTVTLMIDKYKESWGENAEAAAIGADKARQLHGEPSQSPALAEFGCVLLAPGTPMKWNGNWMPPVVTAMSPDGKTISGVTDPSMINNEKE